MRWFPICLLLAGCDQVFGLERPPPPPEQMGPWLSVVAGRAQTCGIQEGGTLWCWGTNLETLVAPTRIGDARWTMISTREGHLCGIQDDSTLWCWGDNLGGQLGNGMLYDEVAPIQVPGAWIAVSTGTFTTCAIRATGVIACWGSQFGPNQTSALMPEDLAPDLTGFTTVEVGGQHACALRGGELWCWGDPTNGRLGDDAIVLPIARPQRIGTDLWSAVSAAGSHSCAIRDDGRLACWGDNRRGQIGDGTRVSAFVPTLIGEDADWTAVATAQEHSCGVRDGQLWCWGDNTHGQYTTATSTLSLVPIEVEHERAWQSVALGPSHLCALDANTRLFCAGSRASGQLGDGPTHELTPAALEGTWSQVSLRGTTACALDAAGTPHCWGYGLLDQIGDGATESRQTPTRNGPSGAQQISVGTYHTCALRTPGSLSSWCWGIGSEGQLGTGRTTNEPLPVQSVAGTGLNNPRYSVIATGDHTCAIDTTASQLWCWGANRYGQLGELTLPKTYWPFPARVNTLSWLSASAGRFHTCGIDTLHRLLCWGRVNDLGSEVSQTLLSVPASLIPDRVAAGWHHTCVWKLGGPAACWGDNTEGAVGAGTPLSQSPNLLPFTWHDIAVGVHHSCGITADRSLWCWGDNTFGQLGTGTREDRAIPSQVGTERDWEMVAAGEYNSCALKTDGTLFCWGDNTAGQLGNARSWRSDLVEVF